MGHSCKPLTQGANWVTHISKTLHEQALHVFEVSWQGIRDSIPVHQVFRGGGGCSMAFGVF
jgi:hypothetical protein